MLLQLSAHNWPQAQQEEKSFKHPSSARMAVKKYREKATDPKMWTVPLISVKAKAHRLQKQHFNLNSDSTFIHGSWLRAGISLKALIDFIGLVRSGKVMEQMHFLCFQNFNNGSVNKFTMKMQRVQPCTDKEKWTSTEWLKGIKIHSLSLPNLLPSTLFPWHAVQPKTGLVFLVENQKRRNIFFCGSHLDSELLINNGSFSSSAGMRGLKLSYPRSAQTLNKWLIQDRGLCNETLLFQKSQGAGGQMCFRGWRWCGWESEQTGEFTTATPLLLTHQGLHEPQDLLNQPFHSARELAEQP